MRGENSKEKKRTIMRMIKQSFIGLLSVVLTSAAFSQTMNRIHYNNQDLFLSGANLAWINYANDVGSSISSDTVTIGNILVQMHNHGGNAVRWWLHTNGAVTPEFSTADSTVIGPGVHTISDMKKVLDIAWQREIGVDICLWSFGMMNTDLSSLVLARNKKLLLDTNYTRAYINNCLIPMVNALKGHPAILTWEIFNEPEGMASEFYGFGAQYLIPMSAIQRFINLCAGAIHRADPHALVTNGAWSFYALTDNTLAKASAELSNLTTAEKQQIGTFYQHKYGSTLTSDEIVLRLQKIANGTHQNYYRDDRLIAVGGDPMGILDFYSVHYYSTINPNNQTGISPFHHPAVFWGLTKPIVVGEFPMESGRGIPPGIPTASLYDTLYQLGYAGALAWSFTDPAFSSASSMLAGMQSMWNKHKADVDVNGIAADWPTVNILSPLNNTTYPDSTQIAVQVVVIDTLSITSIDFYIADTLKVGSVVTPDSVFTYTSYFTFRWKNILAGQYNLKAAATNSHGHQSVSNVVQLYFGMVPMTRMEAEAAARKGSNIIVKGDPTASKSAYLDIATADTNATITWRFINVLGAGKYPISFGYKLNYQSPKTQFINVNGVRVDTVEFTAASTMTWYEKTLSVDLKQDTNTVQIQLFWGWMSLDYLAVPISVVTSVKNLSNIAPEVFSLQQNFPNPFNPSTTIGYSMPESGLVKLVVYDVLGRLVATLVDRKQTSGVYTVPFHASSLTSGVYFYRLNIGTSTQTKKMMLLK